VSRFDHAPTLPPYDTLGPTHGADNACLWAAPPRFVERPLLARPGGPMSPADLAVTATLQGAVLAVIRTGTPAMAGWEPYEPGSRCTAILDARTRIVSDPAGERRRAWEDVTVSG
jgi:para-nitrobenzyl esterase